MRLFQYSLAKAFSVPTELVIVANAIVVLTLFLTLWAASLLRKDASIVDLFWGIAFVAVAWLSLLTSQVSSPRSFLIALLVSIWGLRLSGYLTWRNWGKSEDSRYRSMRDRHGARFPLVSLFTVFLLQGLLVWIISLPVQIGVVNAETWNAFVVLGGVVWLVGFFFEVVGDYQLARFKADPDNKGRVMNSGLWRYTRHPNYFGDFLVWWGLYLTSAQRDSWWWTIIGPLVMSVLLVRVSGVRLLESSLKSRLEGYETYKRCTSAFFPLPPKNCEPSRSID